MLVLLFRMLTGHLVADFVLQGKALVERRYENKWRSGWLYLHGMIAGLLVFVFSGFWSFFWLPVVIFVTHVLLDGLKSSSQDTVLAFVVDQLGHIAVIVGCWAYLTGVTFGDVQNLLVSSAFDLKVWTLVFSYTLVIWPAGILIGKFTAFWEVESDDDSTVGLKKAGLWIGRLERVIILTSMIFGRFELIGFLIAAKSIFRYGGIKKSTSRKEVEYILIGTLSSFVIAMVMGLVVRWII